MKWKQELPRPRPVQHIKRAPTPSNLPSSGLKQLTAEESEGNDSATLDIGTSEITDSDSDVDIRWIGIPVKRKVRKINNK